MLQLPLALGVAFAAAVAVVNGAPAPNLTDTDILTYALTLEHLENAFYSGALAKFNASDFGSSEEFALFQQIGGHEATHVQVLTAALAAAGAPAVAACNYSFPYTDVPSFKALSMVLEGVGVTAYLGAAQFITNKELLTAAGSILTTEARHASWIASVNGADPWSGPFDTPLSPNDVFSLAKPFIAACPQSNPALPLAAFPALNASASTNLTAGQAVTFSVAPGNNTAGDLWIAFLTGTAMEFVPYQVNQSVTIPSSVNSTGTIYAVLTTSNTTVSDDNTVAGPAILMFNAQFPPNTTVNNPDAAKSAGSAGAASSGASGTGAAGTGAAVSRRNVGALIGVSLAVVAATALAL